ncbi:MAG: GNAT family N-acetyltransferase [Bacteroidetes bacterium]|nr:GNAT family N-acetyltransferase [Bacteroidota bacterium]
METNKDRYRIFCQKEKLPLFQNDWWLDAVCGEEWDAALVWHDEQVVAALPYHIEKKGWFRFLNMPKLTGFLGPAILYPPGQKYASRLSYEMEMTEKMIDQLPPFSFFRQNFHHSITNWLPFYWKKFSQTTRYTYVLELNDLTHVFEELKSSVRGKIRKASELVSVSQDQNLEEFYSLFCMTFERQKLKPPVSFDFLKRIDNALIQRSQRKIFFAVDSEGKNHSALYLSWDHQTAYVHMVGEDPALRNSGAGMLLIWKAIEFTKNELKLTTFDFLGSMIESVEPVRRAFGARQIPYFQVRKINSPLLKLVFAFFPA